VSADCNINIATEFFLIGFLAAEKSCLYITVSGCVAVQVRKLIALCLSQK